MSHLAEVERDAVSVAEAADYLIGLVTDGCTARVHIEMEHDGAQCPVHEDESA